MPFNSYPFFFLFLPAALFGYYVLALTPLHRLRLPFLILATLGFYARGAPRYLPLLVGSILLNYLFSLAIDRTEGGRKRAILTVGVTLNVAALLYYKYTNFFIQTANAVTGDHWATLKIALPLAISFYTFQQIAYLVDVSKGLVRTGAPLRYFSSILFFPSIISGPIVFYRELGPQLEARPDRDKVLGDILIGLTMFAMGMFKKTVIADTFGAWVDPAFDAAHAGHSMGLVASWAATAAYLLQIYFDFSGYSDMAIGLARMLGVQLPLNFFSPIRCTSIVDYWRRWHITLGRFVNLYVFQPIAIPLARLSAERGLSRGQSLALATLLPTFLTMLIIGSWHGGAWTYVVFGAMHGVYMVVNEVWNYLNRKKRKGKPETAVMRFRGNLVTMLAVIVALVAFRSADLSTAGRLWSGMIGMNGVNGGWDDWPVLKPMGDAGLILALIPGFSIAYLLPNTQQVMTLIDPALEWKRWRTVSPAPIAYQWRPTAAWALATGVLLLIGLAFIARGATSFVYFAF